VTNEEEERAVGEIKNKIDELVSRKISDLIREYKKEGLVTRKLEENLREERNFATEIADTIVNDIAVTNPRYLANVFRDVGKLKEWIAERAKKAFQKRIDSHKRRVDFIKETGKIRGKVEKDYSHLKRDERRTIADKQIEELRKGWLETNQLTEEDVKTIDKRKERAEERKKYRETERGEERESELKKSSTVKLFDKVQNKIGKKVMDGFVFAALVGIGVIISATIGAGWMMILAFMSFGVYFILPNPDNIEIPKEIRKKIESISREQFEKKSGSTAAGRYYVELAKQYFAKGAVGNSAVGILRSIFKLGGFALVIMSLVGTGVPMVNIIIIIIAFAAYYSCKIVYDPLKPHETIESLFRFGFLGIYVIPIFIFISQFDSWVLGGIAFAFFAIPPIPKEKGNEEMYAATELFMKALFALIMIAVLVGFFAGWGGFSLPTAMSTTFLYFWVITGISGFFSPSEARPGVGFLMLAAATVIYGLGPGQQELMSSLLGPWWPTLQNTLTAIGQPLSDAFSGIGNTFSSGWLLMTNPVGYATQLMNGSHAQNPQGVTGAHGIEFNSFTISEIYPNQPFMTNVIIRNNGAFEAENVRLYMTLAGGDLPSGSMTISNLGITPCAASSGLPEGYYVDKSCLYSEGGNYFSGDDPSMERQFVNQYSFEGEIICDAIKDFGLREKAIPLRARVVYDYQVDSTVDVSFMSEDEWNRLARENLLDAQLKFVQSQYSSAPVKMPIGTAGLKNPILATQTFHISILLDSDMGTRSMIRDTESIELAYPAEWKLRTNAASSGCTVMPSEPVTANGVTTITFDYRADRTAGAKTIVCHFHEIGDDKMGGSPTKTYKVTAHANYTFEMWRDISTRIEFGGFCCLDTDCPTGYECDKEVTNSCRVKGLSTITSAEAINIKSDSADINVVASKVFREMVVKYWKDGESEENAKTESVAAYSVYTNTVGLKNLEPGTKYKYKVTVFFDVEKTESGTAATKEFTTTGNGGTATPTDVSSLQGYCGKRLAYSNNQERNLGCLLGMGGCTGNDQCTPYKTDVDSFDLWLNPEGARSIRAEMVCAEVGDYGIKACCYSGSRPEACKAAFEEWLKQTKSSSALLSAPYLYPDEKAIHAIYDGVNQ